MNNVDKTKTTHPTDVITRKTCEFSERTEDESETLTFRAKWIHRNRFLSMLVALDQDRALNENAFRLAAAIDQPLETLSCMKQ